MAHLPRTLGKSSKITHLGDVSVCAPVVCCALFEQDHGDPLTEGARMRRRAILLLAATAVALLVASSAALAVSRVGTSGDDTLRGTNGTDAMDGRGGNDVLLGYKGTDALSGGTGRDAGLGGHEKRPQSRD